MLTAQGLAYRRGDDWLFKNLSFSIYAGQMIWLRGQNGRGKTSLLRLVVGLAQPDEGQLTWDGLPGGDEAEFISSPVYIGHHTGLKDDLTACESLQFLAQLHGRPCALGSVNAALRRLGVHHRRNQSVRSLSQGQRKRVTLARLALEITPSVWVLDEPYDALDADGIAAVDSLMHEHTARGGSILLTSHIPLVRESGTVEILELQKENAT